MPLAAEAMRNILMTSAVGIEFPQYQSATRPSLRAARRMIGKHFNIIDNDMPGNLAFRACDDGMRDAAMPARKFYKWPRESQKLMKSNEAC